MTYTMNRRDFGRMILGSALMMGFGGASAFAAEGKTAICYNVPAEWAGWGSMLRLIAKESGINVPIDNKNSGQSVSQVIAEAANPVGFRLPSMPRRRESSIPTRERVGSPFPTISRIRTATGCRFMQARWGSW